MAPPLTSATPFSARTSTHHECHKLLPVRPDPTRGDRPWRVQQPGGFGGTGDQVTGPDPLCHPAIASKPSRFPFQTAGGHRAPIQKPVAVRIHAWSSLAREVPQLSGLPERLR